MKTCSLGVCISFDLGLVLAGNPPGGAWEGYICHSTHHALCPRWPPAVLCSYILQVLKDVPVELGILLYLIAIVNAARFQSCYVSLISVKLVKVVGDTL